MRAQTYGAVQSLTEGCLVQEHAELGQDTFGAHVTVAVVAAAGEAGDGWVALRSRETSQHAASGKHTQIPRAELIPPR